MPERGGFPAQAVENNFGGGAGPRRPRERKCNRMEAQVMTNKMQESKAEAAEFLIDTRRLPPELRWKIQGMVELFDFLNTDAAKAQMQGNSTAG